MTNQQKIHQIMAYNFQILEKISLLGWDYSRFSTSGQKTYDEILELVSKWEEK